MHSDLGYVETGIKIYSVFNNKWIPKLILKLASGRTTVCIPERRKRMGKKHSGAANALHVTSKLKVIHSVIFWCRLNIYPVIGQPGGKLP